MTVLPGELCTCVCHDPDMEVHHCMPCCAQCPHCGANIHFHAIEEHETRCKEVREKHGLPLNQYDFLGMLLNDIDAEITRRREEPPPNEIIAEEDRAVLEELGEIIDRGTRREAEEKPSVKFLRECQERERKLGVK